MHTERYLPEGLLMHSDENRILTSTPAMLKEAFVNKRIIEGNAVLCDEDHNLTVDFGCVQGIIPYRETALGIENGSVREIAIISRVGKAVSCIITDIKNDGTLLLSRREPQKMTEAFLFEKRTCGDVIPARITHLEPFGAFADIGCGLISLLGIEAMSVSRISHPSERFSVGQDIFVVISGFDREKRRVFLSHRELLGTWEENAALFSPGQTVTGIVRGIEEYGIFVELSPNLSGLAEISDSFEIGDIVSVFIKSITHEKMKIKLVIIDKLDSAQKGLISDKNYFIKSGHIERWEYSPLSATKKRIRTEF